MSLGLCLRASDCENAWQVGLARRAENVGCLFTPPLLNSPRWLAHVGAKNIKARTGPELRPPATTSHLGGHPPIEGRDERERCARKRSEAERLGCAVTGSSRVCCARLDAVETLCDTPIIGAAQMPSRRPDSSSTPAQSSNSRSLITRSRSRARVRARALGMRGDGSNVCCYVGGVRDRCSHDAGGHNVFSRPRTASAMRRIPRPLWSQT